MESTFRLPHLEQPSRLSQTEQIEVGTVPLGLLAGVEIDLVLAILAADALQPCCRASLDPLS